jgi:hypothetical protein
MNAAVSFSDAAAVVTSPTHKKQSRTEEKEYYGTLDRLIDSITGDFSRKWTNLRLKAHVRNK